MKMNSKNIIKSARNRAEKMVENGLYSRFKLSKQDRIEKAMIGCIGEIAFQQVLEKENIKYQTDNASFLDRNTDEFDFKINGRIIDVKVAKKSTAKNPKDSWTYGYPEEQNPRKKDYIVVGWVDLHSNEVGFYGWIRGEKVSDYSVVRENGYAGYKYLTPNHEFKWGALNKDFGVLWNFVKEKYYY